MNKLTIYPIGSGSSGNSVLIKIGEYYVLIDVGISVKRINESLKYNELSLDDIDVLLITHTHSDHINGLKTFYKNYDCEIFASKTTSIVLNDFDVNPLSYNNKKELLPNLFVTTFNTSHDCPGSCGYVIEYKGIKVGYATDLGVMDEKIFNYLKGSHAIIIESNHDLEMLENGPYPFYLKERIRSESGHLSNDECAKTINKLTKYGTKHFFLAHLSRENNSTQKALDTTLCVVDEENVNVNCLPVYGHDKYVIEIRD